MAGDDGLATCATATPPPSKADVMAEIARLALEGESNRAIARTLGVPRQTVDRCRRKQRRLRAEAAAQKAAEAVPAAVALLEAVYRQAIRSPAYKETQAGKAAMLGKAIQAATEICKLQAKHLETLREDLKPKSRRERAKSEPLPSQT